MGNLQVDNHLGAPYDVMVAPRAIDTSFRASGADGSVGGGGGGGGSGGGGGAAAAGGNGSRAATTALRQG